MEKIYTKVIKYNDIIESYSFTYPIQFKASEKEKKSKRKPKNLISRDISRRTRLNRLRNEIRRLVALNFSINSTFLTLTFKENIRNVGIANKEFTNFVKRLKDYLAKKRGKKLKYLTVIQFQDGKRGNICNPRGCVHYHIILNRQIPIKELQDKIWGLGYCCINKIKDVKNLGAYICCYLTTENKDCRLDNKKAYFKSRNLEIPKVVYLEKLRLQNFMEYKVIYRKKYNTKINGNCEYLQLKKKTEKELENKNNRIIAIDNFLGYDN